MPSELGSISTKCGEAPKCEIEFAVATKLKGGINTSSFALTPTINKANLSAEVPLFTAIVYLAPVNPQYN